MNNFPLISTILLTITITTSTSIAANDNLISQTKQHVKNTLKDPESAQFKDVKVAINIKGDKTVCGQVNAKNSYGGYTGFKSFYVKNNNGLVHFEDDLNYKLAGCEGKNSEAETRKKLEQENLNQIVNTICFNQTQFIEDIIRNRKTVEFAYAQANVSLEQKLKSLNIEQYSLPKEEYLEGLSRIQADPVKVKTLKKSGYIVRHNALSEIRESCWEKHEPEARKLLK